MTIGVACLLALWTGLLAPQGTFVMALVVVFRADESTYMATAMNEIACDRAEV